MKNIISIVPALSGVITGIILVAAIVIIAEKSNDGIKVDARGDYYRSLTHIFVKTRYCRFNSLGTQVATIEPKLIGGNKMTIQDKNLDNVVDDVVIESQQKINGVSTVFKETILCDNNKPPIPACKDAQIALDELVSEYFETVNLVNH